MLDLGCLASPCLFDPSPKTVEKHPTHKGVSTGPELELGLDGCMGVCLDSDSAKAGFAIGIGSGSGKGSGFCCGVM